MNDKDRNLSNHEKYKYYYLRVKPTITKNQIQPRHLKKRKFYSLFDKIGIRIRIYRYIFGNQWRIDQ